MKHLFLVLLFVLCGCQQLSDRIPLESKTKHEKEIAALQAQFQTKLEESNKAVIAAKDEVIGRKDAQIQAVADVFYANSIVFKSILEPLRTDLILMNLSEEGWASIGHLQPTYEQMVKINERIAKELDATKTSLADLKKSHDEEMAKNAKLSDEAKAAESRALAAEKAKEEMKDSFNAQIAAKQRELNAANDRVIAVEKQRADDSAARHAAMMKLSGIAGLTALAFLIATIWSPVLKEQLGISSGACAFVAISVWYIKGWMVAAAFVVVLAVLIGWIVLKHRKEEKVSDALVLAMQDVKESSSEVWGKVAPVIQERLKRYTKKGGQIVTEVDHKAEDYIDEKLAAWDRK